MAKSKNQVHDWSMHRSLMLMVGLLVILTIAFQSTAQVSMIFDYYVGGMLTGLSTSPVYEGQIMVHSYKGASTAMQELSKYGVKTEIVDDNTRIVVKVYASTKQTVLEATQKGAEAADKAGELESFTIIKQ